jgi:hypothetical protein
VLIATGSSLFYCLYRGIIGHSFATITSSKFITLGLREIPAEFVLGTKDGGVITLVMPMFSTLKIDMHSDKGIMWVGVYDPPFDRPSPYAVADDSVTAGKNGTFYYTNIFGGSVVLMRVFPYAKTTPLLEGAIQISISYAKEKFLASIAIIGIGLLLLVLGITQKHKNRVNTTGITEASARQDVTG